MKIAVVHPFFDSMGGSEQTTLTLLKALNELGHTVKLYSVIPPKQMPENIGLFTFQSLLNPSDKLPPFVNWLINGSPSRLKRLNQEKKISAKALDNEDLVFMMGGNMPFLKPTKAKVFVYCNSIFQGEADIIMKKYSGKKAIYDNMIKNKIKKKYLSFLSSNVQLIANSFYTKTKLKDRFYKDSIVIYPPVNIEKFKNKADYEKKNRIASVIRISPEKNPIGLIDTILESGSPGEICCNTLGKSNEILHQKLIDKTRSKNINLYSNFPDMRVETLLAYSKVYLQMSKETFGIAVIEAMASGCIPIVPNNSANKETVPFDELRFEGQDQAVKKIKEAMDSKYDYLISDLRAHASKFSINRFKDSIDLLISTVKQNS